MANWRSKNALPQRSWLNWGTVGPLDEDRANLQASFMIKSELIQRIASQNPHLFQRDIDKIVNAIFDEMIEALRRGDRVELRGFGTLSAKLRGAHTGRNPRTWA